MVFLYTIRKVRYTAFQPYITLGGLHVFNGKCEQVDARKLKKQSVQSLLRVNGLQDALKANFEEVHFFSRFPLNTDPNIKTTRQ